MRTLIIEDDPTSSLLLQEYLKSYGPIQCATNGRAAVEFVRQALAADQPFHLLTLDLMMPEMDGHAALQEIRALEAEHGIFATYRARVVMTSAVLSDAKSAGSAYRSLCDAYVMKPIDKAKLLAILRQLALIN